MVEHFYQNIHGWFTYPNLYRQVVVEAPDEAHFVEVGTWMGKSAAFMAVEIINSGKNIRFDCVDTWAGSEEHTNPKSPFYRPELSDPNWLFKECINNLSSVKKHFNPVRLDSISASRNYDNNSLDFVFIDAAHDYKSVVEDIEAWLPKVKTTGILAGHDYHQAQVKKAVHDVLGTSVEDSEYCWVLR